MPKIDIAAVPERKGVGYPAGIRRAQQVIVSANASASRGLAGFRDQPDAPAARQLVGPASLAQPRRRIRLCARRRADADRGRGRNTATGAGDCAAFAKSSGNGHHLINRSDKIAVYIEVGSRQPDDVTTCSDVDMMSTNADGRFLHKDGGPYG